ncbi:MAG: NTP transferase domain-containing protein [Chloroflexi bacterium]|nr:NTP transferase domain-containing protein [Chloroflexota bacterium]
MSIDAVVTAGGIPEPGEPLYELTQGQSKALLDIAGKPMGQWVLDALGNSGEVDNVVLVGVEKSSGLTCMKPLYFIPNQGGMLSNIIGASRKISEINPTAKRVLIASSDIPAVTAEIVDWVVGQTKPKDDILFNVVERSVMESLFPDSKRTFTKLKGIEVCGGDMNVASMETILAEDGFWQKIADARKNPLKQAALVGFDTLLVILLRLADIDGVARRASKNLGINGRAVLCPYPELAMDIDKTHHLEVVSRYLKAKHKQ